MISIHSYETTLVATRVTESQVDKAARLIFENPGISHSYELDHHFNLWVTLSLPLKQGDCQTIANKVSRETRLDENIRQN